MPSRYATSELEEQAAKFRNTDQLHQPDQSQHQSRSPKCSRRGKPVTRLQPTRAATRSTSADTS